MCCWPARSTGRQQRRKYLLAHGGYFGTGLELLGNIVSSEIFLLQRKSPKDNRCCLICPLFNIAESMPWVLHKFDLNTEKRLSVISVLLNCGVCRWFLTRNINSFIVKRDFLRRIGRIQTVSASPQVSINMICYRKLQNSVKVCLNRKGYSKFRTGWIWSRG